ncbi:phosphoadenosine phosphosulfate reductase domain-containing protein [Thermus filiformis]|uniref:phosphoadenosine phosphosulfate reductase domain-containing protein n=1 Tax=Thermus filiformis TaxID=276 RepID=UPI0009E5C342|nr:phosphoadenosine phosphosulfate reductase family protein [Thermus filiformis]
MKPAYLTVDLDLPGLTPGDKDAERILEAVLSQGVDHWILTYSGGKDSTTTTILFLEWWEKRGRPGEAHLVYADTGLEIPTLHAQAMRFLEAVRRLHASLHVHVVKPDVKESFWVNLIGKGYPPPHNRFRWCTARLKIRPMDRLVKSLPGRKAIVTGVRFGESDARDLRLNLSCSRGGECGQGAYFQNAKRLDALYVAPIAFWRECWVWDYVNLVAPSLGYPTEALEEIYGGRDTRFGCWTCTLVRRDRAMEKVVADDERYRPLLEFRLWLLDFAKRPENRVKRSNGLPGRLTLAARRRILKRLKEIERHLGTLLLSREEEAMIRSLWKQKRYNDG